MSYKLYNLRILKTFQGTTKKCENKNLSLFFSLSTKDLSARLRAFKIKKEHLSLIVVKPKFH